MSKLVFGVGINDSSDKVVQTINNKKVICPYYRVWVVELHDAYLEIKNSSNNLSYSPSSDRL